MEQTNIAKRSDSESLSDKQPNTIEREPCADPFTRYKVMQPLSLGWLEPRKSRELAAQCAA